MQLSQSLHTTGRMLALQLKTANRHILRALLSLASAALLLRVGGMLNQVVVSASFGASASMDAYFVAAAFPLLLVQLMSSAIEAAVIPVYSHLRMHASREELSRLFSTLLNLLVLVALPLTLLLLVLRQSFVLFTAPGLDAVRLALAVELTPLLYLVLPLSLLLGLLECILNADGQFGWPAYAGLLVPLTTVGLTWLGGRTYGVLMLCAGALLGTLLQLVVVIVRARQARLHYQWVLDLQNVHLRAILRAIWPLLLGALISQGSPLVDQIFASLLPAGSISALSYALKLIGLSPSEHGKLVMSTCGLSSGFTGNSKDFSNSASSQERLLGTPETFASVILPTFIVEACTAIICQVLSGSAARTLPRSAFGYSRFNVSHASGVHLYLLPCCLKM